MQGDGLVKAIDYCLKYWSGLTLFLKDLSVPLSNNDAERALRHVVMGRKNFAGSKSIDGADVAAVLYTVIESAKRVASIQPTTSNTSSLRIGMAENPSHRCGSPK